MPSFSREITFDFEVYCDTCGHGLCSESREVLTLKRGQPSIRVNVCPKCMEEKNGQIKELEAKVTQLESELADAASYAHS